ncbi:site-specific integrase [Bacillus sp. REN10]|uniref:site-specific integrase n=1 Tax=Bacillus sp. REN10 TaxID=2782541 RepID=UPI00193C4551
MATFRQLKSGRWQARVSQDGHEFSIGTFRTKKEAMLEAGKVEEKIYYGHTLADKNKLFGEVAKEWLHVQKREDLKESTFIQYDSVLKNHILPYFEQKKIFRIKRIDIKRWSNMYAEMVNPDGSEKYSYGSRLRYLSILKSIFHYATNDLEILEKDPSIKLRVPRKDKAREEDIIKYYSLDELNQLLDYMKDYKPMRFKEYNFYYVLFYLLSRTGLRISESLALTWDDVIGDILIVNKQTSRDDNNRVNITSPKNLSSNRKIKMDGDLVKVLKKLGNRIIRLKTINL